jgi:hypothetical protein
MDNSMIFHISQRFSTLGVCGELDYFSIPTSIRVDNSVELSMVVVSSHPNVLYYSLSMPSQTFGKTWSKILITVYKYSISCSLVSHKT